MSHKPEIQYVGQFYVYGSEAREAQLKARKATMKLPKPKLAKIQKIYIDPVALLGIFSAAVILVAMVVGAVQLSNTWNEYKQLESYVTEVKRENAKIEHAYRIAVDLEQVRNSAQAMGMIPVEEAETVSVKVTVPQHKMAPTMWENVRWFIRGLVD